MKTSATNVRPVRTLVFCLFQAPYTAIDIVVKYDIIRDERTLYMKHGLMLVACLGLAAFLGFKWLSFVRDQQNPRIDTILKEKQADNKPIRQIAF